jgi:hypothetical protein
MTPKIDESRRAAQLAAMSKAKSWSRRIPPRLGDVAVEQFKKDIAKKHDKLSGIAQVWMRCAPEQAQVHCTLAGFTRGVLAITVDSSAWLYEVKTMLLNGLQQQLLLECRGLGLRKITLKVSKDRV